MDHFALLVAAFGTFGFVCGFIGYRIGVEDGQIEERKRLYWRTRRTDRERI